MRLARMLSYLVFSLVTVVAVFGVLARAQEGGGAAKGRDLLYVTAQGTAYLPPYALGLGVLVYDVNDNFRFVKRFSTFDYAASVEPEQIKGIAASAATGYLYLSTKSPKWNPPG